MKIKDNFKKSKDNLLGGLKRFPVTNLMSILLGVVFIISQYLSRRVWKLQDSSVSSDMLDFLLKSKFVIGLAIPLFLAIEIVNEYYFKDDKKKIKINYILGIIGLIIYQVIYGLGEIKTYYMVRFMGLFLALIVASMIVGQKERKGREFAHYVINLIGNGLISILNYIILFGGIVIIGLTIDALFNTDIAELLVEYGYSSVMFFFALPLYIGGIPRKDKKYEDHSYSKVLVNLLKYVIISLISIYTLILYAYFIKILLTWNWPEGLVSHLVLWYTTFSVGIMFILYGLDDEVGNKFIKIFPKVILPILLMMFIAVGQRIGQYGITVNRYFVLILGIWVTLMMIYIGFKKDKNFKVIPLSMVVFLTLSVVGPVNARLVENISQNNRLEKILKSNNMLVEGKVLPNKDISEKDKEDIDSILGIFKNRDDLDKIKVLDKDFKIEDMEDVFGFYYEYGYYDIEEDEEYTAFSFFDDSQRNDEKMVISGYDYLVQLPSAFNEDGIEIEGISIKPVTEHSDRGAKYVYLEIYREDEKLGDIRFEDLYKDIILSNSNKQGSRTSNIDMRIDDVEIGGLQLKFIANHLNGVYKNTGEFKILDIDYYIKVMVKDLEK